MADIIGAGELFQKEEDGDTGIGLNIVRTGKIRVKGLVVEYGEYSVLYDEYSPTPSLKPLSRLANPGIWAYLIVTWWGCMGVQMADKSNNPVIALIMLRRIIPSLDLVSIGNGSVDRDG